jgi:hypothetical protein
MCEEFSFVSPELVPGTYSFVSPELKDADPPGSAGDLASEWKLAAAPEIPCVASGVASVRGVAERIQ